MISLSIKIQRFQGEANKDYFLLAKISESAYTAIPSQAGDLLFSKFLIMVDNLPGEITFGNERLAIASCTIT